MFASKTPRDLNQDPAPFVWRGTRLRTSIKYRGEAIDRDPRPEFDHVQHNEPNPILILFRKQRTPLIPLHAHVGGTLNGLDRLMLEVVDGQMIGAAHVSHARRVLTRLARLAAAS